MKLVAITGGIGSGKSIVSRVLNIMGYRVYDCDSRAKALMQNSQTIHASLIANFGNEIIENGKINSQQLAAIVFNTPEALQKLNAIVHPEVRNDIRNWANRHKDENILFVETAILRESNMESMFDLVIKVTAPTEIRIARVMKRNAISQEEVQKRIENQSDTHFNKETIINNDNKTPIIKQILRAIERINNEKKS